MAFKNIAKHRANGTARYTFDTLDLGAGSPWIEVRFGGKGTPGFRSDEVRLANAQRQRSDKLTERGIDDSFADDAKLIAAHCAVKWGNLVEDDGSTPLCTPTKVEEFLLALIENTEDIFLDFRKYVRNRENFVDAPPVSSGVELGKS